MKIKAGIQPINIEVLFFINFKESETEAVKWKQENSLLADGMPFFSGFCFVFDKKTNQAYVLFD